MNRAEDFNSFYAGRRVCVTGGAGFIGSSLVDALVACNAQVVVVDDLSHGRRENLAGVVERIEFVEGSILDCEVLNRALNSVEIVFHQAALTSVPRSVAEPVLFHKINATGTLRVLEAARAARVGRFVLASSSSVYGEQDAAVKDETLSPQPMSPYAVAKCTSEYLIRTYARCFELSGISLRYFNIFGPRQRPDSPYAAVIPRFIQALQEDQTLTIFGDGSQTRDFTFVDNVVRANLLAGTTDQPLHGEKVNIACGEGRSLLEVVEALGQLLGIKPRIEFAPARPGEVLHSRASITAAQKLIGYQPLVRFDEGLQRTVQTRRVTTN